MEDSDTVTFNRIEHTYARPEETENVSSDNESDVGAAMSPNNNMENLDLDEDPVDGVKLADRLKEYMGDLKSELRNSVEAVRNEVRSTLSSFDGKLREIQSCMNIPKDRNVSHNNDNSQAIDSPGQCLGRGPLNDRDILSAVGDGDAPRLDVMRNDRIQNSFQRLDRNRFTDNSTPYAPPLSNKSIKMKPQTYDGSDDLDEYLTQFNLVAELNGWDYETKSLFLASSMVGGTRALLCELEPRQRKDYISIVNALQNRYGSINRAEVYRSKLQGKVLGKNETLPELAQTIRKLTRKAYPSATNEVIDLLAMDYFIDAIPDTDIRLRLREVGPKTIGEAEQVAVRLDAHKVADKSRGRSVRVMGSEESKTEKRLDELSGQLSNLLHEMQNMKKSNELKKQEGSLSRNQPSGYNRSGRRLPISHYGNKGYNYRREQPSRSYNFKHQNGKNQEEGNKEQSFSGSSNTNKNKDQGNMNKSGLRTETRQ